MVDKDLSTHEFSFSNAKKYRYVLLGIILGLCCLYLFRSCMRGTFPEASYRIGQNIRWQDVELMGKERNFTAFNNDLLLAMAKQEHVDISLVITSNPLLELNQGRVDGILTALKTSYLNENHLLFSEPYFLMGPVLIIPEVEPADGWNEQRKKIVGIPANTPHLLDLDDDPTVEVRLYHDILKALADLSAKRIDAAIFPLLSAYTYTTTFYKNELRIGSLPLTNDGVRLVALKNKDGEELINQFNQFLRNIKENGTYDQLLKQWGWMSLEEINNPSSSTMNQ